MKFTSISIVLCLTSIGLLSSCGDVNQKYKEQQGIAIDASNQDLQHKAAIMENNLAQKKRFYGATQGIYTGEFSINVKDYPLFKELLDPKLIDAQGNVLISVRFNIIATLPATAVSGVRTEPQITSDLNLLSFNNTEATFWFSKNPADTYGCIFSSIHPDLDGGKINLRDSSCADSYSIDIQPDQITPSTPNGRIKPEVINSRSSDFSLKLQSGEAASVDKLHVLMTFPRQSQTFEFWVSRGQP